MLNNALFSYQEVSVFVEFSFFYRVVCPFHASNRQYKIFILSSKGEMSNCTTCFQTQFRSFLNSWPQQHHYHHYHYYNYSTTTTTTTSLYFSQKWNYNEIRKMIIMIRQNKQSRIILEPKGWRNRQVFELTIYELLSLSLSLLLFI